MENEQTSKISDNLKIVHLQQSQISNYSRNQLNNFQDIQSDPEIISSKSQTCVKNSHRSPSQQMNGNFDIPLTNTIFSYLQEIKEMKVEQVPDFIEAMCECCCQKPNIYRCYAKNENDFVEYFYLKEFSDTCTRLVCPVNYRKFSMKGKFTLNENESNEDNFIDCCLKMIKPMKCPIFCLFRPLFIIEYLNMEKSYEKLGTIIYEFSFYDPIFVVQNENGENIYYITGKYCQLGLMCRNNIFGKTEEAHFYIYSYNDKEKVIGDICKEYSSSYMNIADDFLVTFPENASAKEKLLLMMTAVMIDYQYFEKNTISNL